MNKIVVLSSFLLAIPFASSCNKNIYKITINGTHIASYTLSDQQATRGKDFTVKFVPEKFYRVYIEDIKEVSVKGEPFPEGFGWTFEESESTLTVKGEIVTGNVNITVDADLHEFYVYIYPNSWPTDKTLEEGGFYKAPVNQEFVTPICKVLDKTFTKDCIAAPTNLNCRTQEVSDGVYLYVDTSEFYRDFDLKFKTK